jgi:dimeric dUTPase (all-alpha-NTP-PPase superfamily)
MERSPKEEPMQDKLEDIVARQLIIANKFHDIASMDQKAKETLTVEMIVAILAELGELLNGDDINGVKGQGALRWKHWKTQTTPADPDYIKTELIDILHFTVEALLIWGCSADEIHSRYVGKNQENLARYKANY